MYFCSLNKLEIPKDEWCILYLNDCILVCFIYSFEPNTVIYFLFFFTVKKVTNSAMTLSASSIMKNGKRHWKRLNHLISISENCMSKSLPGCVVTWAWSLAKGQYMVSWLLTGAPPPPPTHEQIYWQNRETTNIGLASSVDRAPARPSGSKFFSVYLNKKIIN